MTNLVRSAQFDADLYDIWQQIARRHVPTADRVTEEIEAVIELATGFPGMGTPVPHLAPNLRRLRSGPYLIYYRLEANELWLIRVLNGRRKITSSQFQ